MTISLCMIVKNEEKVLKKCLASVQGIADEIVIADTGSSDATKDVARKFTNLVYEFTWTDDFSAARNFVFDKASGDYLLWLDADDILLPNDRAKLKKLKKSLDPAVDVVMMKYNTGFDADGNVSFSYYRERLVKRACHFRWKEPVHEYLETGGRIINSDVAVTHTKIQREPSDRNIKIYEAILAEGGELSPRGQYYYARELKDNGRFAEAAAMFRRFLDGGQGWVEDKIAACLELSACLGQENDPQRELLTLLESFSYDLPRAEICCRIGYYYKQRGDYERAAFWFRLALSLKKPKGDWGFIQEDCWGFIPAIELAVCLDRLGRAKEAAAYNEMAATFKPRDPSVKSNRRYFQELNKKAQT